MIAGVEKRLAVRFYHPGVSPALERDGQGLARIQGADLGAIALPPAQESLRIDGCEEARYGQVQALGCSGGPPQGTLRALPFRTILTSDELGPGLLLLQALQVGRAVCVQLLLGFLGTPLLHSSAGILSAVAPALLQDVRIAHPVEVADPLALLTCCLLGSSRQGGGHGGADPACSGHGILCRRRIPVRPFPVGTALPAQSTRSGSDPLVGLGSPFGKASLWLTPQAP